MLVVEVATKSRVFGNYLLSRGAEVTCKRVGLRWRGPQHELPSVPLELIRQVLSNTPGDVLLASGLPFMPVEVRLWFEFTGLRDDLLSNCQDVVFCSHLERVTEGIPRWTGGLVIDGPTGEGVPSSPYRFPEKSIRHMADEFLKEPVGTIFVNAFSTDGQPLASPYLFTPLVYYLGYLKTRSELLAKGINPDLARHELKRYLAHHYEIKVAKALTDYLEQKIPESPSAAEAHSIVEEHWLPRAEKNLRDITSRLSPEELLLVSEPVAV